ncbi:hypothetical protein FACS1894132_06950 [Clostridia bacterium]|nr:hypothetical protein FACS1894132_06950 [Clostridia bacterium]
MSGDKKTDYYLFHANDENIVELSLSTLPLIKEKADNYVICADVRHLSENHMKDWNITFIKMPRDFGLLPEIVKEKIHEIKPEYEIKWQESEAFKRSINDFSEQKAATETTEKSDVESQNVTVNEKNDGDFFNEIKEPKKPFIAKTRAEKLYAEFTEMFPKLADKTHDYERYGNEGDTFEPLSVEHHHGEMYSYMTFYFQNGNLMRDPDFTFELDHENKTLNIHEYQIDGVLGTGMVYNLVNVDGIVTDEKMLASLEKNFLQNLKNVKFSERPLTIFHENSKLMLINF